VEEKGKVSYTYKAMPPMKLETVIAELYRQHQIASEVFKTYWNLTKELSVDFTKKPTKALK
jgi:hypothetical protein